MSAVLADIGHALGVHHGLPLADYLAAPGISNSGLSDFARSPRHYHALHINPDRPEEDDTASQLVGRLAHCAILEPSEFEKRYAIGPVDDKRLAVWKAWEAKLPDDIEEAIKPSQATAAKCQALSVRAIPDVAALLAKGAPEVSAFWIDPTAGELCRCRPDWVHPAGDGVILVDVKTCGDASPREFARQVARMGYHRQAAFYSDGYEIASGRKVLGFVFVAVETAWPFAASAAMLDDASLEQGRVEIAELLPRFAACRAKNEWPCYGDSISLITLPAWALATNGGTQ